jgi:nitrogen fixation/metabolism regulation signal transduction histidine kinase
VRLRGRFALWFALAALVPIAVAAVVTQYMVARSYRQEHVRTRVAAESAVRRAVGQLQEDVARTISADALGSKDHELVGAILRELSKGDGELDDAALRRFKESSPPAMRGLGLDLLLVTGPDGRVLAAPHYRALTGEDGFDEPEQRARSTAGRPFYTWEKVMPGDKPETVLVAAAARFVSEGATRVALEVGRRVDASLIESVRRPGRIDARVVDLDGKVIVPPAEADWDAIASSGPMKVPLLGADGEPVAYIEVAVADEGLDDLLAQVTGVSVILAAAALALTILLGVLVARRMTRDLDRLVEGAQAAARGDLEHRVTVSSKDEVEAVASAFNLMMEDLRTAKERAVVAERIAAWQEVARRLAHEIKNPLTPIQMAMDTLRKTWRTKHPKFEEILEESTSTVLEEADRLKRIVSEFSEFARMPKPTFGPTDIGEAVTSALSLYQGAVPVESKLTELPPIEADRGQLTQVLLNLLETARDAIADAPGGRISVAVRRGDTADRIEISVEDNGPGVPADIKDRMFTPYFTTKQSKGGTGLGLAIVHRIVSDHGGRILVTDSAAGGARFVVELPLRQGQPLLASRI